MYTAPATVYCLLVPYLIAGGRDTCLIIYLFLVGHLLHYAMFGHNSVMDYWHDVNDPSKKHHPLISKRISLDKAHKTIHVLLVISNILLLIPLIFVNTYLPLIFLFLSCIFGHAYNDGLDHFTAHSWIPISLCFTFLCATSYLIYGNPDTYFVMVVLWAFLTIFYQIAWEGNLKDVWNPYETCNPLRKHTIVIGERLIDMVDARGEALSASFLTIRGIVNSLVITFLILLSPSPLSIVVFTFTSIVEFYSLYKIHFKRPISRGELLSLFGVAEAFEFFRLISILDLIGLPLIAYGILYFTLMNKLLWGTKFAPRV